MTAAWEIRQGHVLDLLSEIESGTVQTCVTSPPYHGLRAYGTEPQVWMCQGNTHDLCTRGGHDWDTRLRAIQNGGSGTASAKQISNAGTQIAKHPWTQAVCLRCGCWRGELGSEPTVDLFIHHLVLIFRAVRRTLRDDATLWLNLGDSYSGSGKGPTGFNGLGDQSQRQGFVNQTSGGLPAKNLQMVPWRLALALQDDGWIVRSVIVWAKRAPMPESVTDRPTSAWEPIFLLSKSRSYFYDAESIKEPASENTHARGSGIGIKNDGIELTGEVRYNREFASAINGHVTTRNQRNVWEIPSDELSDFWKLSPESFPGAHFAVFPTEIPRRCILAGSRPGDLVLDPFSGAGTSVLVANRLGRRGLGLELNPEYAQMARDRIQNDAPLIHEIAAAPAPPRTQTMFGEEGA